MSDHHSIEFRCFRASIILRTILFLAGVAGLLISSVPQSHAQGTSPNVSAKQGESMSSLAPYSVVLNDLPQVSATNPVSRRVEIPSPRVPMSPAQYQALKEQTRKRAGSIPGNPVEAPGPRSPLSSILDDGVTPDTVGTITTYFYPLALSEYQCPAIPSDMAIAASPLYLIQVVNGCITIIDPKLGTVYPGYPKSLNAFFGGSALVGDVRAEFDSANNRFIVSAADFTHGVLLVAVTATSNPTGTWHTYTFAPIVGGCPDFPMLGQSLQESGDGKGAIYLGYDQYGCGSGGTFEWGVMLILPKTPMYAGKVVNHYHYFYGFYVSGGSGNGYTNSLQPANVVNSHDRPRAEYAVQTYDFNFGGGLCSTGCNGVVVWSFSDGVPSSGRSPSFGGAILSTTNNYYLPGGAEQPNETSCINPITSTPALIDTGDVRITGQVAYSSGALYAGINTLNPLSGGSAMLTWQIVPHTTDNYAGNVSSATIANETLFYYNNSAGSNYYPAIIPDSEGNITTVFNASNSNGPIGPSVNYMSQRAAQAPGTVPDIGTSLMFGSFSTTYCQLDSTGRNRWGDYTAGAATGDFPNSQWFSAQFSDNSGNWETAIGKTGYTSTTQF